MAAILVEAHIPKFRSDFNLAVSAFNGLHVEDEENYNYNIFLSGQMHEQLHSSNSLSN